MNEIFFYILTVVLHEGGHFYMAESLGYRTDGILFSIYGAGLKSNHSYKSRDDILISLAGPLVNVILIIVCVAMWWIFPTSYLFTLEFVRCNIIVLVFNILPIYPLDGGRVLFAVLGNRFKSNTRRMYAINHYVCLSLGVLFILLFVVSLFYSINMNLLFIGMFLTTTPVLYDKNKYFDTINAYNKKATCPQEVRTFRIDAKDRNNLYKYLSPHYISRFEITNGTDTQIIDERDLFN